MADDFSGLDQAIAQVKGVPTGESLDDAISQVQGEQRTQTAAAVRNSLQFATDANPEQEAKYRHLSRFISQPLDTVRSDPAAAHTAAVLQATDASAIAADHPVTAKALSDPSTARMLHDDISATAKTESLVSRLTSLRDYVFGSTSLDMSTPSMAGDLGRSLLSALSAPAKYLNLAGAVVPIGMDKVRGAITGIPTTQYEDPYFASMVAPADQNIAGAQLPEHAPIERRATAAVGQLAGMLAEGFATGGEAPIASGMQSMREFLTEALAHTTRMMAIPASSQGMETGANVFEQTGDAGAAVSSGLAQYLVGTGQGVLPLSVGGGLLKRGVSGAVNSVVGGQAARAVMNEVLPEGMRQSFDPMGALTDAIVGGGMGGVMGPRPAPEWLSSVRKTYADAANREATSHAASLLSELGATIGEGKFRERDQESFKAFIEDMHGPDLYVGGRELAEALDQSGVTGEHLLQSLPELAGQMREALQSDGMVRIPMADYAAHIAGSAADEAIQQHLRLDPNGVTFSEAKSGDEVKRLQAEADRLLNGDQTEQDAAFTASSDEVHKHILDRLNTANRFPADVNRQYADLVRAFYDTTAQRTGVLPADLLHAFPMDVKADGMGELQQNGELMQSEPAARASYSPDTGAITLTKNADLSSFLHEVGHHFLETHARIALDPNAPESLRADVHAVTGEDPAAWLAKSLDERRDVHENFARSFEQYLMEGKAPSQELRGMFQRFRSWLVQVYRNVAGLRASLSDDVRQVMDRMLASDDAIREQQQVRGMESMFPVKPEGMSDADFATYRALGEKATEQASATLQDASLRNLKWLSNAKGRALRAIQAQAKEARSAVREEVTKEVDATLAFQAKAFIDRATNPNQAHQDAMDEWRTQRDAQPKGQRDAWTAEHPAPERPRTPLDDWKEQRAAAESAAREAEKARVTAGKHGIEKGQALAKAKRGIDNAVEAKTLQWEAANPKPTTERPQVNIDVVAERFGFSSGDEMLQAIRDAGDRKDVIQALTDQRMLQRHGELTDSVSMERAAEEAIHTEARARFIATELNALAKATGSPGLLAKAARDAAHASIAQKRVRDLRPDQYTAAEARAGRESLAAFKKGETETAAVKKRAQLLSNAMAKEALDVRTEVTKGVAYLKKFDKASIRANLGRDFIAQIDALLERYDLRQASGAKIDQAQSLRSFVQARINAGEAPIPVQAETLLSPAERAAYEAQVASRDENGDLVYADGDEQLKLLAEALDRSAKTPYQNLTVEAFRGLRDLVKTLEHQARQQNKLLTAEAEKTYTEARDEIASSIDDNARASGKGDRTSVTLVGKALQAVRDFGAAHIKVATWARIMDGGKDNGPVWRYLVRPANDAASKETTMRAEATLALSKILRPVLSKVSSLDQIGKGRFFKELGTSLNWQERFAMALNFGNEGNLQRLLGGGIAGVKQRLSMEQILPVLRSLSAEEWHAVQGVWDHLEGYREQVGALERRMSGAEPKWVDPRAFKVTTADGQTITLRGGYFPIVYDPRGSLHAQQHADAADAKQMMKAAYSAAATQHGFTKNRAEEVNGRPLMLNLHGLYRGVGDVIHDLSWREWVRDANKLMRSKTIDAQIRDHYGPEVKHQFEKWRDDIVVGTRRMDNALEKTLGFFRQGVSAAGLTFNVISAAMQPLGFTQSIVRIGPQWAGKGLAKYIGSPIDATREANAKSEWMANRMRTRFRELNELRNAVSGQTHARELMGRYGYFMMMRAQQMVDVPTWHGAYEKAVAGGESESTAVHLADQAVKDAQGGGEEVDQAGIERGGPMVKLFTTFYGFMNTAANLGYLQLKTERSAAKLAVQMLLLYTIPAVMGDMLKDALTPGESGKWDEEHVAASMAKSQISFLFGLVAFGREFGGMVNGQDYAGPAGLRTIVDAYKLEKQASQGEFDRAFRKSMISEMGDLTGIPGAQINRFWDGVNALNEGQTDNPIALATGVQTPH